MFCTYVLWYLCTCSIKCNSNFLYLFYRILCFVINPSFKVHLWDYMMTLTYLYLILGKFVMNRCFESELGITTRRQWFLCYKFLENVLGHKCNQIITYFKTKKLQQSSLFGIKMVFSFNMLKLNKYYFVCI